jgi:hypothetical protein
MEILVGGILFIVGVLWLVLRSKRDATPNPIELMDVQRNKVVGDANRDANRRMMMGRKVHERKGLTAEDNSL